MNAPLPRVAPATDTTAVAVRASDRSSPPHARPTRAHRRRRRGQREADKALHNHATDRWMVSYADFITLLFAFFVVMYAMSSVNEGRYRVLSGALSTAFAPGDATGVAGGQGVTRAPTAPQTSRESPPVPPAVPPGPTSAAAVSAAAPGTPDPDHVAGAASAGSTSVDAVERAEIAKTAERVQHMRELATRVDDRLQALVRDGQVQVTRGARGIAIEINAAVLFDPARAELKPASFDALRSLAQVLSGFVEPLQIEGHSDDVPIATREYRSNWELSAARAASVGRFLIDQGIAPGRIGIAGYAEYRPLVGNASPETRARNRRVTLVVLSADDTRPREAAKPDSATAGSATPGPAKTPAD